MYEYISSLFYLKSKRKKGPAIAFLFNECSDQSPQNSNALEKKRLLLLETVEKKKTLNFLFLSPPIHKETFKFALSFYLFKIFLSYSHFFL